MAWQVQQLPNLIVATTSALVTNGIGHLDDAESITLFFTSSATTLTSGTRIEISQFDPADSTSGQASLSTQFFSLSSAVALISTAAPAKVTVTLTGVSFKGLRLAVLASANVAGEVVAFASKQIFV